MKQKHAPTPYKITKEMNAFCDEIIVISSGKDIIFQLYDSPENAVHAEFIVRACNSNDALLKAVDAVISSGLYIQPNLREPLQDALTLAKGE